MTVEVPVKAKKRGETVERSLLLVVAVVINDDPVSRLLSVTAKPTIP